MSKAAKQSIFILILLLIGSLCYTGFSILEKQKLEREKKVLQQQLKESQEQEKKSTGRVQGLEDSIKGFEDRIKGYEEEKAQRTQKIQDLEKRVEGLSAQVSEVTTDRDKWKRRIESIQKERDELIVKLQNLPPPQIIYKEKEPEPPPPEEVKEVHPETAVLTKDQKPEEPVAPRAEVVLEIPKTVSPESPPAVDEEYVASVLKEKASLELKVEKLNAELSKRSLEIVDLKKTNTDLQMELDALKHDKEEMEEEITHKEDLLNNISLELARTKNEQKFTSDKVAKLKEQNTELRKEIKKLASAKSALEKSIVHLTQEKDAITKQLGQTEALIQSKINEVWEIKSSLDQSFQASKRAVSPSAGIELPPIVVSSEAPAMTAAAPVQAAQPVGLNGKILSVNKENNFVIVDMGENAGLRLKDNLSVFRGSEYLARLEVIQVRKDIAAADILEQRGDIKVGDEVK